VNYILMLRGYKRSGKDTAAAELVNLGFERRGFADSLKDSVSTEFGVPRWQMDDPSTKEAPLMHMPVIAKDASSIHLQSWLKGEFRTSQGKKPEGDVWYTSDGHMMVEDKTSMLSTKVYWTPRALCIFKGSACRSVDPNHWVKTVMNSSFNDKVGMVIADWRYRSEVEAVRSIAGPNTKVITINIDRFDTVDSTDPSERDLDGYAFDVTITNRSTLDEFLAKVKGFGNNLIREVKHGTSTEEPGFGC